MSLFLRKVAIVSEDLIIIAMGIGRSEGLFMFAQRMHSYIIFIYKSK